MLAINREKTPKTISAEPAAAWVKSGMWLDYGGTLRQPDVFDKALAARIGEVTDIGTSAAPAGNGSSSARPGFPVPQHSKRRASMTNYHATLGRFQPSAANPLAAAQTWVSSLLASVSHWLIKRHTRKVLEGLDRGMLEDIGVPHEDPSLRAGELKRYPDMIRRGMWSRD